MAVSRRPSDIDHYLAFFSEAIRRKKISHAYILEGESSAERMELARRTAKMLLCEKKTGCGQCPSCRAIEQDSHPDLIRVTHEKEDVIKIDEIRHQLIEDIQIRPYSSDYKIYIMDEAEKMNPAAQNALLKTLEEPPYYGMIFLLTTNANGFLPTILSRAVRLPLTYAGKGIEDLSVEEMVPVISVLAEIGEADRTKIARICTEWKEGSLPFLKITMLMRCWFRDLLVWKSLKDRKHLWLPDFYYQIQTAAERYSYYQINQILQMIDRTEDRIGRNVNYELSVGLLLSSMKWKAQGRDIADDGWEDSRFPDEEEAYFYSQVQAQLEEEIP